MLESGDHPLLNLLRVGEPIGLICPSLFNWFKSTWYQRAPVDTGASNARISHFTCTCIIISQVFRLIYWHHYSVKLVKYLNALAVFKYQLLLFIVVASGTF